MRDEDRGENIYERYRSKKESSFNERRRKADWITKMAAILSFVSWVVAFVVWVVLESASPDTEFMFITSFFSTRMDVDANIRGYWDSALLPIVFWLLVASLAICIAAFVFNALRMRRKTDKYRKSIIIIGAITIIGLVAFLVVFGNRLILF